MAAEKRTTTGAGSGRDPAPHDNAPPGDAGAGVEGDAGSHPAGDRAEGDAGASPSGHAPAGDAGSYPVIRLRSPEDALAWVPYFVGFHPTESLVILGFEEPDGVGSRPITMRSDLPRAEVPITALMAYGRHLATLLKRNAIGCVLLIAYSRDRLVVGRMMRVMARALTSVGIGVVHAMRSDGARWWPLNESDPSGRLSIGRAYDLAGHPSTTEAVYKGMVALSDEDELRRSVAPVTGSPRVAMLAATSRILAEPANATLCMPEASDDDCLSDAEALALGERIRYVVGILTRALDEPRRLDDEAVARISLYLRDLRVRDEAWAYMTHDNAGRHVDFWRDVARRAVAPYDVAPLALLAFAAWLSGEGALARIATERALAVDPHYRLASIVADILESAIHPREWEPHPPRFGSSSTSVRS